MKTKLRKQMVVIVLMILLSLLLPQTVKGAVLQANPTTNASPATKIGAAWLTEIRNMETTGQAMGLSETIDSTTLKGTTSNGIDVHMMKSTEYGAMAILSASGYGNPKVISNGDTTTGNKTGVYMQILKSEWVAGAVSTAVGYTGTSAHRYYNTYTTSSTSAKLGDALTLIWHNPGASGWLSAGDYGFLRGGGKGVFGHGMADTDRSAHAASSRAAVVIGSGF